MPILEWEEVQYLGSKSKIGPVYLGTHHDFQDGDWGHIITLSLDMRGTELHPEREGAQKSAEASLKAICKEILSLLEADNETHTG